MAGPLLPLVAWRVRLGNTELAMACRERKVAGSGPRHYLEPRPGLGLAGHPKAGRAQAQPESSSEGRAPPPDRVSVFLIELQVVSNIIPL